MEAWETWCLQARHDLDAAKAHLESGFYDWSCFACQQAIEKSLKALFIYQRKSLPPKTHLSEVLAKELNLPDELLRLAAQSSGDYIVARYPDSLEVAPFEIYSEALSYDRIAAAERLVLYVKEKTSG